ncbi:MAG: fibronectin type III domain-containing protein, partial [Bacteroidales bacterium]|nr:fibronectin type III domain-containing protein [Bacteroidales bacterium]
SSSWQSFSVDVAITTAGTYNLVFYWGNDGSVGTQPPAAIDNVEVYINTCPAPIDLYAESVGSTTINLDWTDMTTAQSWIVEYGPTGYVHGSTSANAVAATSHPVLIQGLDTLTSYDFYVRSVCTGDDTGRWSRPVTLMTNVCDNGSTFVNYTDNQSSSTSSYYGLGYTYYPHTYNQTIIDSSYMANMNGDISALGFFANSIAGGNYVHNVSIWLANVPEANLANGWIMPDDSLHIFVNVLDSADLTFSTTGMHVVQFDTSFTWDGHSNILMAIIRSEGTSSYGSSYTTPCHYVSGSPTMTRYSYSTTVNYNINTTPGGTTSTSTYHGDFVFFACGGPACPEPSILPATDVTYQSATINWNSNATDFEVAVKAATDGVWPAEVSVSNATSYSVTNLTPATTYQFRVRAICDATEGLISEWAMGTFTTDSLPCFVPTDLHTTNVGYTSVNLAWSASSEQNHWTLTVWNTAGSVDYDVTGNAAYTVTGLTQDNQYYAAVKAICGNGAAESEYSDTIQFATKNCEQVAGVTVTNITDNSAIVSWQAATATSYEVDYGPVGHGQGQGTTVTVNNATTYTITGLESETGYSVYVRALCEADAPGPWSQVQEFTTLEGGIGIDVADGMNVSIYPNPTSSTTTIALSGVNGDVAITVVDMNGRVVMSDSMSCEGDCVKTMEVSGLAQGAYFVRINGENVNMVKKLVVK